MSQEHDLDQTVTVSRGDVTVEKSFEPDEFPVPAVTFNVESSGAEPIDVRLVDQIPEEFPMSAIGFHPEFESDNWSAYKDHRVVFERTLEPGEEIRTVYGVRLDREEDAAAFLGEPTLEGVDESDESVEDVLGEDRNQAVRDVLAGDRDTLVDDQPDETVDLDEPDDGQEDLEIELEDPTANGAEATDERESDAPSPRSIADGTTAAVADLDADAEVGAKRDGAAETERATGADEAVRERTGANESEPPAAGTASAAAGGATDDGRGADGDAGGVAGALAAEIRAGDVDEADLELLRDELDLGVPRSVDVRIQRLQRTVSDLNAYADALEEFIDEEGTAEELIRAFRGDVEDLSETVTNLEDDLASTDADVEALRSDLSGTERRLDAVEADVRDVEADVRDVETDVEDVTDDLDTVSDEVNRVTEEIDYVTDEIGTVSTSVETLRTDLDREIDAVERQLDATADELETTLDEELDSVRTELDRTVDDIFEETEANSEQLATLEAEFREFEQFRDRLEQAFGGVGGVDGSDAEE